jgi:hypothetical protein
VNRAHAFEEYIDGRRGLPFDWGARNCCHFMLEWVLLVEPASGISAKQPRSLAGSLRYVRKHGSLRAAVTERLGREPIDARLASVGDIVLCPAPGEIGEAVGICNGRTAVLLSEAGLCFHDMSTALCAWPVGGDS